MFFVTYANLWSFAVFLPLTYIILIVSTIIYILPISSNALKTSSSKIKSDFYWLNNNDFFYLVLTFAGILISLFMLWTAPITSAWFGHVIITAFQTKISFLIIVTFLLILLTILNSHYLTSREVFDFVVTLLSFVYWLLLLFYSNSLFTSIFIIEVLSALLFLLLVTSTFSSAYYYKNTNLNFGHSFQNSTPYTYLQSILYFFWVSLISSLNLFLFTLLLYTQLLTFDWFLIEHTFIYFVNATGTKDVLTLGLTWFVLMSCIFLKCGIAPLYIWKPTFFKGIPFYTLFFYVCFFYFLLFLFIINLITSYFSELYYYYVFISLIFITSGLITLLFIICESYYLKSFIALSSILNSLFVILALTAVRSVNLLFFL